MILLLHSILRYFVLIFLVIAIIRSLYGWLKKRDFTRADHIITIMAVSAIHLQLIIGIILYILSPFVRSGLTNMSEAMKDTELRFWTVEHISIMVIAIAFITLGRILVKKASLSIKKHKRTAIFYLIGLILIVVAIPWPFSSIQRAWV